MNFDITMAEQVNIGLLQENEVQDSSTVAVILCGHKDMTEKISSQMQAAGVDKEKILTNY